MPVFNQATEEGEIFIVLNKRCSFAVRGEREGTGVFLVSLIKGRERAMFFFSAGE